MTNVKKTTVDPTTRNNGKFAKGNKEGNRFSSENQPKDRKLKRAIKKAFQEVAKERLEELQDYATLQMSEWVRNKLIDIEELSTSELEKIQKFLEFLRDSSGQKPTEKLDVKDVTPEIKVATKEDLKALEKLKNADFDKGIS